MTADSLSWEWARDRYCIYRYVPVCRNINFRTNIRTKCWLSKAWFVCFSLAKHTKRSQTRKTRSFLLYPSTILIMKLPLTFENGKFENPNKILTFSIYCIFHNIFFVLSLVVGENKSEVDRKCPKCMIFHFFWFFLFGRFSELNGSMVVESVLR